MNALFLGGGWLNFVRESFFERAGTGAIGAVLSYPAYAFLGKWGGFVVLLFMLAVDVVLLRRIPLRSVGAKVQETVHRSYEDFRQQQSARREERREAREERRRNDASWASWDQPTFGQGEAARSEPLQPVETPPAPGEEQPENPFRIPEYLTNRKNKKPVFGTNSAPAAAEDMAASDAPAATEDAPQEPPYETEPPFEEEDLPPIDVIDGEEPVDVTGYEEIPDGDAARYAAPDPLDAAFPDDLPEDDGAGLDSDDGIYDGFDAGNGIEPPFDGENKPPFVEEKKPAKPVERRLDHTPIVPLKKDKSHDLSPTGAEYNYPPVDLLALPRPAQIKNAQDRDQEKAAKLEDTLHSFGINATLVDIAHGPAVTRFELAPAPGVKVSRITALADDIALNLAATSVRIEAPIPGKAAVGVEIPNDVVETVPLREVLESPEARKNASRLAAAMGKDNGGRYIIGDIAKMPHVLIAGATGSGKSVCINCIVCSILYRATPDEVRLIMIDPKVVELSVYNGIPHLLQPVVTDPKKAAGALHWAVAEMTDRYKKFAEKGVRDIKGYNKACASDGGAMMPQIVIIIDELADLMMVAPGEVEDAICRLAQLARAAGIHLVIATQRPSVNVITGVIKANIPARIAFTVSSYVDSRTILDVGGAEKLLGRGDMLFAPAGANKMQRVQGAWVSDEEIHAIVEYIKSRHEPEYNSDLLNYMDNRGDGEEAEEEGDDHESDKLLPQALEIAINAGQVSISMLQRKLSIGYARAGRLVDEMANRGYVSQAEGSKPRAVIITREEFAQIFGKN
ncbi:MAG: DNA translocase FtsK [Clostridia bacterium]|nr:DNA translocase FtsK [Clostridia bacterium]